MAYESFFVCSVANSVTVRLDATTLCHEDGGSMCLRMSLPICQTRQLHTPAVRNINFTKTLTSLLSPVAKQPSDERRTVRTAPARRTVRTAPARRTVRTAPARVQA